MTVIAAYDVHENDRRARLAAVLQAYGDRIQKSVFVLEVDEDELGDVQSRALRTIDTDTDSLWLARQCSSCWEELVTLGQTRAPGRVLFWSV